MIHDTRVELENEQSNSLAVISELEERITDMELDRDDAHRELEEERLVISFVTAELAKSKEDLRSTSSALEEERTSFCEREATSAKQIMNKLEERLVAMEQQAAQDSNETLTAIAQLEECIADDESERDAVYRVGEGTSNSSHI